MKEKMKTVKKKKRILFPKFERNTEHFMKKKNESLWNKQEICLIWPLPIPSSLALQ